ncbi:MAG: AAA family ATPase, partial [Bacteroidales bacterium]|nr:AAA family ATPase [Bacteroidales bacterium]
MQNNLDPIIGIRCDIANRTHGDDIGMFKVKTANDTVHDAALRPIPRNLFMTLWYEGEVTCLFADSNVGKSIFAVQIADQIATTEPVLYVDCELSEKQFQLRYTDAESGRMHRFP